MIDKRSQEKGRTRSVQILVLLAFALGSVPGALPETEAERVGMEFRLGYSHQMLEEIGSGPAYGVRIIFVTPFRLSGYLGGEIHASRGEPLRSVFVPGWSLRSAESDIYVMPAVIGATYAFCSRGVDLYSGAGLSWTTIHERTKAVYVSGDYTMTEWTNAGGSGPGLHCSFGARHVYRPEFSAFLEVAGLASWIDFERPDKVRIRSVALFTGVRF